MDWPVARRLDLHVGHGKTGSSFLQAWLAANSDALRGLGVHYPLQAPSGRTERHAQRGLFSMGNGFVLEEVQAAADPAAALRGLAAALPPEGALLFSDERLMKRLVGQLPELMALAAAAGFAEVRLLLFVRDPLEHACSLYLEMVKAHGLSVSLSDWLAIHNLHLHLRAFLEEQTGLDAALACRLEVHNYSRCHRQLLPLLQRWLGLPEACATWPLPPRQRVNRSLSRRELALLRRLNRFLGPRTRGLGRALVRLRPEAQPARPQPSPAAVEAFRQRLAEPVEAINALLPPAAALRLEHEGADG